MLLGSKRRANMNAHCFLLINSGWMHILIGKRCYAQASANGIAIVRADGRHMLVHTPRQHFPRNRDSPSHLVTRKEQGRPYVSGSLGQSINERGGVLIETSRSFRLHSRGTDALH